MLKPERNVEFLIDRMFNIFVKEILSKFILNFLFNNFNYILNKVFYLLIVDIKYLMKGNRVEFQYHGTIKSFRVEDMIPMKDENIIGDDCSEISLYPITRDTSVVILHVCSTK